MERGSVSAEYAAGALAALAGLIDDMSRGPGWLDPQSGTAQDLVDDLRAVSGWLVGWDDGDGGYPDDQELRAEFLGRATPIKGARSDDAVSYYRPARECARDRWLLTYAAVQAFAFYVTERAGQDECDRHFLWTVVSELQADLWLSPIDVREVATMRGAVRALLDARYTRAEPKRAKGKTSKTSVGKVQDQDASAPMAAAKEGKGDMSDNIAAAYALATELSKATNDGDLASALALAERGAAEYPDVQLPGYTWAQLAGMVRERMPQTAPEPEPESVPEPVTAALVESAPTAELAAVAGAMVESGQLVVAHIGAPERVPEPESVLYRVRLMHNYADGTRILGANQAAGKVISQTIGRRSSLPDDQRWHWSRTGDFWYVSGSREGRADQERIDQAVSLLTGTKLFTIDTDVDNLAPDGSVAAAPVRKLSPAAERKRAAAYRAAQDSLMWRIHMGHAACHTCGTKLSVQTGTAVDVDGSPVAACRGACAPDGPVLDPVAVEEQARMSEEAHRAEDESAGRAPEPEPEQEPESVPEPVVEPVRARVARATRKPVASSGAVPFIQTIPDGMILDLAAEGNQDARVEVLRRMSGGAVSAAEPVKPPRAGRARAGGAPRALRTPAPVVPVPDDGDLSYVFALEPGAQRNATRRDLNVLIYRDVTDKLRRRGEDDLQVAVRIDAAGAGTINVVVPARSVPVDRVKLHGLVVKAAHAVRGVADGSVVLADRAVSAAH